MDMGGPDMAPHTPQRLARAQPSERPQRSASPGEGVALLVSAPGQLSGSSRSKTLNGDRRAASSAFLICDSPRPAPCRSSVSKNPT